MVAAAPSRSLTCLPLSRASIFGLSPKREPMLVKELPSATMKSNSPPTIRCAIGAKVALGSAALAAAGGGTTSNNKGAGVAVGLDSRQRDALESVAVSAQRKNATKIA